MTNSQPYTDYDQLDKDRLIELIKLKDNLIQIYIKRAERLDEWLNEKVEICDDNNPVSPYFYPWYVLEKINKIANEEMVTLELG